MTSHALLSRFLALYPKLRERLTRRLGSRDLAEEALNETYLKVERMGAGELVRDAPAYFFRMAMNAAVDQHRSDARLASAAEIEAAMDVPDPLPGPFDVVDARLRIEALANAIAALPERRRLILESARIHGLSCRDIADQMGLSRRTVETELRKALDHCSDWMTRRGALDFASGNPNASIH